MKNLFTSAILLFCIHANAQTFSCDEKVQKLLVDKIKKYNSKDLIPYMDKKEGRWGYFHRTTKKILTAPIMNEAYFFHPHINFSYSFEQKGEDGCNGKIYGSRIEYRILNLEKSVYIPTMAMAPNQVKPAFKKFIKLEISGFEVDDKGSLTYFNPKFYDEENNEPRIIDIFKANGENYAITYLNEDTGHYYSVINQQGVAIKNFEKLKGYPTKKQSYNNEKDVWFWVNTNENEYILRSLLSGQRLNETFNNSPTWEYYAQEFGYAIFVIGKQKGLMDLTTMKWKIKPSIKNDFDFLVYASSEHLDYNYNKDEYSHNPNIIATIEMINANRKKSYIYIQNSKNQFMDLDLKFYRPIK